MDLVLGSRFAAVFFIGGVVPNPIDIRFQRVSGLSATVETTTVNEGGQNLYTHRFVRGGRWRPARRNRRARQDVHRDQGLDLRPGRRRYPDAALNDAATDEPHRSDAGA